jgi:protein CpxP
MLFERLNLSDAQKEQIKAITDSHRDELKALGDRHMAASDALHTAVMATPFDESTIRSRSADLAVVEADMAVSRARIHNEMWQVLTAEQQAQAQQLERTMRERRGGMRGRRGGPPPR